jgi:hypothetical protein
MSSSLTIYNYFFFSKGYFYSDNEFKKQIIKIVTEHIFEKSEHEDIHIFQQISARHNQVPIR